MDNQAITDKIIAACWKGRQRAHPLDEGRQGGLPCNGKTGDAYRGVNVADPAGCRHRVGFTSNVWMTFKRAGQADMGAHVHPRERP